MLGRQQIAGIPTAISELFKNAHDAYADNVEVDFFRKNGLFVMRDDGVGMTRSDFEDRWLVLGTESKLKDAPGVGPLFDDPEKPRRPILGEKGIGRLAIAAIGPQVLVLTRAKPRADSSSDVVAAFVNWGVFGLPGINLDEIEVPVRTISADQSPSAALIREMVTEAQRNLECIAPNSNDRQRILKQMQCFRVDPSLVASQLTGPSLNGAGHGTHFFIFPTDESLVAALDAPTDDDDVVAPLHKMLIGFTNTMTPSHAKPVIQTAFRDHKAVDVVEDLIGESEFFTPDEFKNADHHVEGAFDEFGQFSGTVSVFGEPTPKYTVAWPAKAHPTECGPFKINFAVVQGVSSQSTVPNEEWARIIRKMNQIGGLYIYRDGIRVLPYGNNDYDFLNIERNRTKSAAYYYFSYRRIFGVIEIDGTNNQELHEKAGREGFRENLAYKQFREILMNFFVQVAADFFREGSAQLGRYEQRRAELTRLDKAKRARDKHVGVRKNEFRARLSTRALAVAEGKASAEIGSVLARLATNLKVAQNEPNADRASGLFIGAEESARHELAKLRDDYRVVAPRGVGLPQAIRRDLDAYRHEYEHLVQAAIEPAQVRIEQLVAAATRESKAVVDRRIRFDKALDEFAEAARKTTQSDGQEARRAADEVRDRVMQLAKDSFEEVGRVVTESLSRGQRTDVSSLSDEEFVIKRTALESEIDRTSAAVHAQLNSVVEYLRQFLAQSLADDGTLTPLDAEEALEEELIALRERSDADLELAQLGIAIQVINHEFEATIRGVRRNIRQLRAWADANNNLRGLYESIRDNFSHLDGYLSLFTPLQRRLYRAAVPIRGSDIYRFLEDLFAERLKRHNVQLQASASFKKYELVGYPSTFYPVFVNLVDNAIYWVSQQPKERTIRLDASSATMIVADSGPGIDERDQEAIFDFGFTRKPGGRGLGLHISRDVLRRANYSLAVTREQSDLGGAQFEISPSDLAVPHSNEEASTA